MALRDARQLPLLEEETAQGNDAEWGTFKDSLRAPIHSWFTYPAGFSYKAVEHSLYTNGIESGDTVYDPFMGTGTTNIVAKKLGINSYGVEAHPFVYRVAKAKLNWQIERREVTEAVKKLEQSVKDARRRTNGNIHERLTSEFPQLVLKCFEENTLFDLLLIRDAVRVLQFREGLSEFLVVGLIGVLRQVSNVATGWPYIAPKKEKTTSLNKKALVEFSRHIFKMVKDVEITIHEAAPNYEGSQHLVFNADSRNTQNLIPDGQIDHIFTSPPYLNNFDYADRTRLELYFFGEAKTWGDITRQIRSRLMTSATTQINRNDDRYTLSDLLARDCPEVYDYLNRAVEKLGKVRLTKGGKKSYDLMVTGYFNDMYQNIADVFRVLKPGAKAVYVLGDSAPYGVHIPTDDFIGKIGLGVGFSDYRVDILRNRGDKWSNNPQRHTVQLKESIVTLVKG